MKSRLKWIIGPAIALVLLLGSAGPALAAPDETVRVIIGLRAGATPGGESALTTRGATILKRYHILPALSASVPKSLIPALKALKQVSYVEIDGTVRALEQTVPWGISEVAADQVHSYNQGGGVKVAIIDTGIDLTHPDITVSGQVTFVSGTPSGNDDNGHGTHVAGTIGARDNDVGVLGVAPQAQLYAVKVLDRAGSGYWSAVVSGIQWAIDNDMDIINLSLGSTSSSTTLKLACDRAYNAGILVVAAAGNNGRAGSTTDNVIYPARYDSVVAVGATDSADKRASFSSTGPAVELAAPGVNIYSTYSLGRYNTLSGTSMATPHVAGVAALVFASGISDTNSNGRVNDEVRARLQETATDLGTAGRDREYGFGRVDAPAAVPDTANHAPQADAGPDQTVFTDVTVTLDGSASSDEDADPLTYQWTQSGGPAVALSDSRAATPTFTPRETGVYRFSLIVNDGVANSPPDEVVITIRGANTPPTAPLIAITPEMPFTTDDLVCQIVASSSDAEGDAITYAYTWYRNDIMQAEWTANTVAAAATAKGENWRCEVTPGDGMENGPAGSAAVTIANTPPRASAGADHTATPGALITLDGSQSADADGDLLTYLWSQTGGAPVILSNTSVAQPDFTAVLEDTYTFQLTVSDGTADAVDSVTITVAPAAATTLHVQAIRMALVQRYSGTRTYALANVTVSDAAGNPVAGVTVRGHWESATSITVSGTTGSSGQVTLSSGNTSRPPSGTTFIFVVDSLSKAGWTYDAAANSQNNGSIAVP